MAKAVVTTKKKPRGGYKKFAKTIDYGQLEREFFKIFGTWTDGFTVKDVTDWRWAFANDKALPKSTAQNFIGKLKKRGLVENHGHKDWMNVYRVVNARAQASEAKAPPAAILERTLSVPQRRHGAQPRVDPIGALRKVIAAHDPGPTRDGLERALSILQSLSALAPRL